jgi:hypothetical protein
MRSQQEIEMAIEIYENIINDIELDGNEEDKLTAKIEVLNWVLKDKDTKEQEDTPK